MLDQSDSDPEMCWSSSFFPSIPPNLESQSYLNQSNMNTYSSFPVPALFWTFPNHETRTGKDDGSSLITLSLGCCVFFFYAYHNTFSFLSLPPYHERTLNTEYHVTPLGFANWCNGFVDNGSVHKLRDGFLEMLQNPREFRVRSWGFWRIWMWKLKGSEYTFWGKFDCGELSEKVVGLDCWWILVLGFRIISFLITNSPWDFVKLKRLEVLV